ncbi:hypothetical protein GGI12_002339 [Dipsacomyces acuminosporus]|nr:hypothetical protein GGI12_002339 [Dipsacomyces acuminosporus]
MEYSILDFKPDTRLTNPRFEGYKLQFLESDDSVQIYPLAFDPVEPKQLANNTLLSYDEISFRVRYNHLFIGPSDSTLLYIDKKGAVNLVRIDKEGPQTAVIFTIPTPAASASSLAGYPGAFALSEHLIIVFDGCEEVYVLERRANASNNWTNTASFCIGLGPIAAGAGEIRKLHHILGAQLATTRVAKAHNTIQLHVCYRINKGKGSNKDTRETMFCIQAIQVDLSPQNSSKLAQLQPTIAHTLHSLSIPLYCEYLPDGKSYMLGVKDGIVVDDTELASIPQTPSDSAPVPASSLKAQYYWTQTETDITVCFQLPAHAAARQISCSFTRTSLNLAFHNVPECDSAAFTFTNREIHGEIVADESVWTLENGQLLTLYLQKAHEGARWPTVFREDDGVLETMDPSEFAVIREQLERLTSGSMDMRKAPTPLLQSAASDTVDQDSGDIEQEDFSVVFSVRDWQTGQARSTSVAGSPDWLCPSLPQPLTKRQNSGHAGADSSGIGGMSILPPVCLAFDVDGIAFGFGYGNDRSQNLEVQARHTGTLSALSYIQASKREKKLMYADAEMRFAVLAESQRRLFVYHQVHKSGDTFAEQNVVDFGSEDGVLLGLQLVNNSTLAVLRAHTICLVDIPF